MASDEAELNLREELLRIDQMRADIALKQTQLAQAQAEIPLRHLQFEQLAQERRWKPWQIVLPVITSAMAAGAALVGATLLLVRYLQMVASGRHWCGRRDGGAKPRPALYMRRSRIP